VINFTKKIKCSSGKFVKQLVMAAAIASSGAASAGVLNFEGPNNLGDSPFLYSGTQYNFSNGFTVETTYSGAAGDFNGMLIDGSDNGLCYLSCPVNNPTNYLAILEDSYMYFYLTNGGKMRVASLSASFIGAGQPSFPAVAGLLVLQGYNFDSGAVGNAIQVALSGPNSAGQFNFANYSLGSFSNNQVDYVRILGYACDASGSCSRSTGLANFAIDNITIPEPGSLALLGLAAAGFAAARRRRRAA
jgi:hypothetical protein